MSLVLPSVKGQSLSCSEYENNILYSLDLANATGQLDCSKINQLSLATCLLANNVIIQLQQDISDNATAIGEVAQDLTDSQTTLQTSINNLITLINNQNATIADLTTQVATLTSGFNSLSGTVDSFNSRLLSVEGRLTTLEDAIASGIIVVWSGLISNIPTSWSLCNGTNGTPDLRDRFIIGAGSTYTVNAIGGNINHTHTITGTTGGTSLTINQMPSHSHAVNDPGHAHTVGGHGFFSAAGSTFEPRSPGRPGDPFVAPPYMSSTINTSNVIINNTGANEAHDHTFSATTATTSNIPPYYALAYIMRI